MVRLALDCYSEFSWITRQYHGRLRTRVPAWDAGRRDDHRLPYACRSILEHCNRIVSSNNRPDARRSMARAFSHKNELGSGMVLGLITLACLWNSPRGISRIGFGAAFLLLLLLLCLSASATSLFIAVALAVALPLALRSRSKHNIKPLAVCAILSAGIAALVLFGIGTDQVLSFFGRDATLTGRTSLWADVTNAIAERPLLGYGYGVFWTDDGPAAPLGLIRLERSDGP